MTEYDPDTMKPKWELADRIVVGLIFAGFFFSIFMIVMDIQRILGIVCLGLNSIGVVIFLLYFIFSMIGKMKKE